MFFFHPQFSYAGRISRCRRHRKIWLISTRTRHTSRHIHSRARRITDTSYSSFHNHRWEHQNTHLLRPRAQPLNPLPPSRSIYLLCPWSNAGDLMCEHLHKDGTWTGQKEAARICSARYGTKRCPRFTRRFSVSGTLIFAVVLLANLFFLDIPEPRFGRPQKVDAYAHLKETKKYIM